MAGKSNDDIAKALANLSHDAPENAAPAPQDREERARPVQRPAEPSSDAPAQIVGPKTDVPRAATPRSAASRPASLEMKRTLIPILLVMGGMLSLGGVLCLLLGEESPFAGMTVPSLMVALGVLIIGAGAATMLQVRHAISESSKR